MRRPRFALSLGASVVIIFSAAASAQTAPKTMSVGDKILADETLFPAALINTFQLGPLREADSMSKVWNAIPEAQRPKLADVQKKYGQADRTIDETAPALRSGSVLTVDKGIPDPGPVPTRETTVHYYGTVGFGTIKAADGEAVWLVTNLHVSAKKP
jgi:hypothetical protein